MNENLPSFVNALVDFAQVLKCCGGVYLNIQISQSQGSAATDIRRGGVFYTVFLSPQFVFVRDCNSERITEIGLFLTQSYPKISGTVSFWVTCILIRAVN